MSVNTRFSNVNVRMIIQNESYFIAKGQKQALLEIFEECQDLAEALFQETLEDWGLLQAIRDGETTPTVNRETIFAALEAI